MASVNVRLHSTGVIGVEKSDIASDLQFDNEVERERERSYIEQCKLLKQVELIVQMDSLKKAKLL